MKANLNIDIESLIDELQLFAASQQVELILKPSEGDTIASHITAPYLAEVETLIKEIITYTPEFEKIIITLQTCTECTGRVQLIIQNTGIDLSKVGSILTVVKKGILVERMHMGTRFIVDIFSESNKAELLIDKAQEIDIPKKYPMYYASVIKRLTTHFSNTESMEKAAILRSDTDGIFLKKVNEAIQSHISDPNFKVEMLAKEMAMSRTQLYRKLKILTQKSPQKYLRFTRLEKAKKLLQSKDSTYNVSEVCYLVGFASQSHFTRSFHKEFGFNPSDFIKSTTTK